MTVELARGKGGFARSGDDAEVRMDRLAAMVRAASQSTHPTVSAALDALEVAVRLADNAALVAERRSSRRDAAMADTFGSMGTDQAKGAHSRFAQDCLYHMDRTLRGGDGPSLVALNAFLVVATRNA